MKTPSIFLSYRRDDAGGHAGRLFDRLRCWFEADELFFDVSSIDCGDNFPHEIQQAIESVKAVIAVIGPDWVETLNDRADRQSLDYVRQEISVALKRKLKNEVRIFPVLVSQTEMPRLGDLHDSLKGEIGNLLDCQALHFPDDSHMWDLQFNRLKERLASVQGVPQPSAQIEYRDGHLASQSHGVMPVKNSSQLNVQAIRQEFRSVSSALLNWPQEIGSQWLERPELDSLHALTTQKKTPVTVLLGEPGAGKSAILARLGSRLIAEDALVLAIKADELPRSVSMPRDLDDWIDCGAPIKDVLIRLAAEGRVVVLIDQLDALSELMDQRTGRLSIIARLVNAIRNVPNLHVILACREFEFRHDARFNSLNAEQIKLNLPSWDVVKSLLEDHGFAPTSWSEEVQSVLSTPQNLAMFLQYLGDKKDVLPYNSYQSLLSQIIETRIKNVHGAQTVQFAEQIAVAMAVDEVLWVGCDKFQASCGEELQKLVQSGILIRSENNLRVTFRHQTVFDFLRTRAFLREEQSLARYVVEEKRQSLFVRPVLWSALNYLRESDLAVYRKQFNDLWTASGLRTHIRNLLMEFLGQLKNPDSQEACWLLPKLEEQSYQLSVLNAIAGSAGWFDRIQSQLPTFMCASGEQAGKVVRVLAKAVSFAPNIVLELVEKYWVADIDYLNSALIVMKKFKLWNEKSVEIACKLADHAPQESYLIQTIAMQISECRPDLAPKIIFRYLQARFVKIEQSTQSHLTQFPAEQSQLARPGNLTLYENLIDHNPKWSSQIEDIARRNPKSFVCLMWPWLVALLSRLANEDLPCRNAYRMHSGSAFKQQAGQFKHLQKSIQIAIRDFAETDTDEFLDFIEQRKDSDLHAVHQLIALGMERIASQKSARVLEYLLDDSRRFAIGDSSNIQHYTQALISAAAPRLDEKEIRQLEAAIKQWSLISSVAEVPDTETRRSLKKSNRMHRLRLLRVIPFLQLSHAGQKFVREEERAFPDLPSGHGSISGGLIGSAMSSEQMEKAADEEILSLFDVLTDDTGWEHPLRPWSDHVGGSIQASREFAKFSRKSPERALRLISRFQSGKSERPAGEALAALAEGNTNTPPEELMAVIRELDERGFVSDHFRSGAARCLSKIADQNGGLNDETCEVLESWIEDWNCDDDSSTADYSSHQEEHQSLLWSPSHSQLIPEGNFVFLDAIMRGYLSRQQPAALKWLGVLERHLERRENPAVWQLLTIDFHRLFSGSKNQAVKFINHFLSCHPDIINTHAGVILVAGVITQLPKAMTDSIVNDWITGSWLHGPQSAGEILAFGLCRSPDNKNLQTKIEQILCKDGKYGFCGDEVRAGIAYTFAEAWREPALRSLSTKYLVRLLSLQNGMVDTALKNGLSKVSIFRADEYTAEVMETLILRPGLISDIAWNLIEGLRELLRAGWKPDLICRVTEALASQCFEELGDVRTAVSAFSGELTDLALTFHRIPDTKEKGLELFEKLIEARSFMTEERLAILDRRAFG